MKALDFVVVGGQRCGTTTIHNLLASHPRIWIPPGKEAPFFDRDGVHALGWDAFAEEIFRGAPVDRLWATVTPQYMVDARVADRIASAMPDVRLVAILRDPVERTFSHWRMNVARGYESRAFDEVVRASLVPSAREAARAMRAGPASEADCTVAWSEYARMLAPYVERFGRDRVLVTYTEDLERDPAAVLDAVLAHVRLAPGWRPADIGRRDHASGRATALGRLRALRRFALVRRAWRTLPVRHRQRLAFWIQERSMARGETATMGGGARRALVGAFRREVEGLRRLTGSVPPWTAFREAVA